MTRNMEKKETKTSQRMRQARDRIRNGENRDGNTVKEKRRRTVPEFKLNLKEIAW